MIPIKEPQGKGDAGREGTEPQERYESYGDHSDYKGSDPVQDPTTLRARDSDHTPNFTRGPRSAKPSYGRHTSSDAEGEYTI